VVAAARFNEADVGFAQAMIVHHRQSLEISDLALVPAAEPSDQVRALSDRIRATHSIEIAQMTGWLQGWGRPVEPGSTDAGSGATAAIGGTSSTGATGGLTVQDMTALEAATGPEFDTLWLQLTIRHHEAAVAMAESVRQNGQDVNVAAVAEMIMSRERTEIDEMRTLLPPKPDPS
jgi:uncharacterized protein (DUF305 family)